LAVAGHLERLFRKLLLILHLFLLCDNTFSILIEPFSSRELNGVSSPKSEHALGVIVGETAGSLLHAGATLLVAEGLVFFASHHGEVLGGAEALVDEIVGSVVGIGGYLLTPNFGNVICNVWGS
jgi:hypothetical protein